MLGVEKSRKLLFFSKKVPKKFKNHDIMGGVCIRTDILFLWFSTIFEKKIEAFLASFMS